MTSFEDAVRSRLHSSGYTGDDASTLARRIRARRDALASNGGKRCTLCHTPRPLTSFATAPTEDGLARQCLECL